MRKQTIGLLVMAYGTPASLAGLAPYYTDIRNGSPPSPELLEALRRRYVAIGGVSPLQRITTAQARALEAEVNRRVPGVRFTAYVGMKHAPPSIEDAVAAIRTDGIRRALGIVMAPHYSAYSVQRYADRALHKARESGTPRVEVIQSWYRQPKFIEYWAREIRATLASLSRGERARAVVVFSAHSLPQKVEASGDPYSGEVRETAELIAAAAGIREYTVAWQSAGRTAEPWIGPDVLDVSRELADCAGYQTFIYCPIGFVSDHLEVLYDNDVECRAVADERGARYLRPPMPNLDPLFIAALGDAVVEQLERVMSSAA